jgi:hypothetical protein
VLNVKNIVLTQQELQQCMEFSSKSAPTQQSIEFGQITTKARSTSEIARDNLIGKIAEIAFAKMLKENYGIDVPLDFNYYPRGKWDDQDAVINGWRIDVKGTRKGGRWMLIEWNKLNFRQQDNNLSHLYVMFSVSWDRNTDKPTGEVSYEGAASLKKLCKECATTKEFPKGTILPGTHTILQADNYGIEFKNLYKHLSHLVTYITDQEPPAALTNNYRNPYTNKTTIEIIGTDTLPAEENTSPASTQCPVASKNPQNVFSVLADWMAHIFKRR